MFWIEDCYWRADSLHGGSWQIEVFPLEVFLSPVWQVTTQRMSCRLFRFVFYLVTGLWPLPQIIDKQPGTGEFNGLWCGPFAQLDRSVLAHSDYCIPLALFNFLLCVCLSILIFDLRSGLGIFCCWRVRIVVLNSAFNNTRRKPPTYRKSLTHFITLRYIEYTSPWAWFELTTLVVIVSLIIVYIHVYHILLLQFSRFLVFDKIRLTDVTEFCTTTSSEGCATWYPTAFPDCVSNNII